MDTDPALMDEFQKPPSEMLLEFNTDICTALGSMHSLFWHSQAELINNHCYEVYPNDGTDSGLRSS